MTATFRSEFDVTDPTVGIRALKAEARIRGRMALTKAGLTAVTGATPTITVDEDEWVTTYELLVLDPGNPDLYTPHAMTGIEL